MRSTSLFQSALAAVTDASLNAWVSCEFHHTKRAFSTLRHLTLEINILFGHNSLQPGVRSRDVMRTVPWTTKLCANEEVNIKFTDNTTLTT